MIKNSGKFFGFTLAEVLITLGIIGVVAAMTISTLLQNAQYASNVSGLKKAYSELSQAYTTAVNDNGTPDQWSLDNGDTGSQTLLNIFSPYLKVSKNCGLSSGCFANEYKYIDETVSPANIDSTTGLGKLILSDGTALAFDVIESNCQDDGEGSSAILQSVCGYIYIDLNGYKKPNKYGVDFFPFWVTKHGIVPFGTSAATGVTSFNSACKASNATGAGCSAWVIYNGNQDYLKSCGSTLSWDGPTSCN